MDKNFQETLNETKAAVKSGTAAIHLCGDDYSRIDEFVRHLALELGFTDTTEEQAKANIVEWNYGYGQVDFETRKKIGKSGEGEKITFTQFLETYKPKKYAYERIILIRNARHVLEGEMNRENLAQLQQTIVHLKKFCSGNSVLIYCDEKRFIPDELSSLVYFLDVKPPSQDELENIARKYIDEANFPHLAHELSAKCVGMSADSFAQILKKAKLDTDDTSDTDNTNFEEKTKKLADKTKKQFVDKSGLLKYVNIDTDIKNVGGLDYLKWWLKTKKNAFDFPEKAKERNINPAKGILLVGMPGCGKSLTSKAVANFFKLPLLSLDLGSLMGKYLGESEENLRKALKLAENSSPCVLWVDEIEKAFAGVGGDESGVSQRLFGYLLTWLNDKTARIFVMATANDVAVLPPEFLRRGRFDEIFYVDFPNGPERKVIFNIHLERALGKENFDKIIASETAGNKFEELIKNTEGYAGSDVEALVNSANEQLWNHERVVTDIYDILLEQRKKMTPLKEVLAEKIAKNREKFGQYKLTSASDSKENLDRFETDSNSKKEEDQLAAAKDDRCPEHVLIKLAEKTYFKQVKLAVLDNPNAHSRAVIDILQDDADDEVKQKAEQKQSSTPQGIIKTAKEGTNEQKLALLKSSRAIPDEALVYMANDGYSAILDAILQRDNIPEAVWTALIARARKDKDAENFILEHKNCPEKIKTTLVEGCITCRFGSIRDSGVYCPKYNLAHKNDYKCKAYVPEPW